MRILVVVPCWDGWIRKELVETLMEYMVDKRYQKTICFSRGRPLEESLNMASHMATGGYEQVKDRITICYSDFEDFEEGYDYMLVNDADNIPMDNFLPLAEHDKDVLFLPYPIIQQYDINKNPVRWGILCEKPTGKGLQEVEAGASGAMMVARRVLEAIPQPRFQRKYSGADGHVLRGVDYKFADSAHKAGFKCWTHWDHRATHWNETELAAMHIGFMNHFTNKK